ncbi:MAG: hypothetical protein JWN12_538 [Candidatus Saccharibacteria bacterium]|nr:hypothetical protein [Candidatus Saccharibacteria bacterium]
MLILLLSSYKLELLSLLLYPTFSGVATALTLVYA